MGSVVLLRSVALGCNNAQLEAAKQRFILEIFKQTSKCLCGKLMWHGIFYFGYVKQIINIYIGQGK